jgi:hypothetical protein
MNNRLFLSAAALLVVAGMASAQAQAPVANGREQNQRTRIRQGVASGELNRREAARMRGREAGLTAEKRAVRADGVVTSTERRDLRQTENQNSRAIYHQKHDAQVR